ncbi:Stemmadenine O-acetyltransferase [Camellia lanceoleosa]|uniref:Stemmadenine O-acetyltransferase n=1 Tax=Camellia lanceoleosa TaxID=1840588 RepID=A0ACC0HZW0_9ERIC|nr:Stemmadenine O-acetyltransferase [Camellia lanceoleosa]
MPHASAATTATTPHVPATTTTHASQLPMPTPAEKTPSPPPGRKLKLHCSTPPGKKTSTPLPNSQSPHHAARSSISHSATPPLLNSTGKKTSTPLPNSQGPHHAAMTSNSRSATPPLLNSTGKKTSTPPPNSQSPHQAATTPHPERKQVFHLTLCYSSPSATPPLLQQFSFYLSPKNPLRNTKPTGFEDDSRATNLKRSNQLKKSLADVLTKFYPLAGRVKENLYIECNDEGVLYLEAQFNCQLS